MKWKPKKRHPVKLFNYWFAWYPYKCRVCDSHIWMEWMRLYWINPIYYKVVCIECGHHLEMADK